jgi:hypothetical protein
MTRTPELKGRLCKLIAADCLLTERMMAGERNVGKDTVSINLTEDLGRRKMHGFWFQSCIFIPRAYHSTLPDVNIKIYSHLR